MTPRAPTEAERRHRHDEWRGVLWATLFAGAVTLAVIGLTIWGWR